MLNISGLNRFYYIRNFTDMRCKYARILSVIRHQLGRDPERDEVFIVMSGNRRLVRLFTFDRLSSGLYEKRFALVVKKGHIEEARYLCDKKNKDVQQ